MALEAHNAPSQRAIMHCAILMATYNGARYIDEQLRSLDQQVQISWELWVSDDGSTDGTLDHLSDARIHLLPPHPPSGSAANNFFHLLRTCDLDGYDAIALCDQDDVWDPHKLQRAFEALTHYDVYSSNVTAFWDDGKERLIDKSAPQQPHDHWLSSAGPGCTYVMRPHVARAFQEALRTRSSEGIDLHDWLLYAFAREEGYRWWCDPLPSMRYRQHTHNVFGANHGLTRLLQRWDQGRGGWYRSQILAVCHFCAIDHPLLARWERNTYRDRLVLAWYADTFRREWHEVWILRLMLLLPRFR